MIYWTKLLIDLIVLAIIFSIQQILTSNLIKPYQNNGFYCNDYSINLEYKSSTVTNLHLIFISLVSPIVILLFIEVIKYTIKYCSKNKKQQIKPYKIKLNKNRNIDVPHQIGDQCVLIGYFLFGLLSTNLITNCGKLIIGRLRPNFLSVCKPNINPYTNLCLNKAYLIPDIDFQCLQLNLKDLQDARKSFPSGHSSLSFYSMIFLVLIFNHICVNSRMIGVLLVRLFQVGFVSSAFMVALSRVTDNKHHPTDVLSGSIIGIVCALVTYWCLLKTSIKNYKIFEDNNSRDDSLVLNDPVELNNLNSEQKDSVKIFV